MAKTYCITAEVVFDADSETEARELFEEMMPNSIPVDFEILEVDELEIQPLH